MDITNYQRGKIIYGITETHLYYSRLDPTFTDPIKGLVESPISGKRHLVNKNHFGSFTVFMHISKHGYPEAMMDNFLWYIGRDVLFHPFHEGKAMHNEFGKPVLFTVTHAKPYFLNTLEYHDVLLMTFKSKENVVMSYKERYGYGVKYSTQYGERL